jgi:hypothetical protein
MPRILGAGLLHFLIVFGAGFALGTLRELVLAPSVGRTAALALELPVLVIVTWLSALIIVRRFALDRFPARLAAGVLGFVLLQFGEAAVGAIAFGRSLAASLGVFGTPAGLVTLAVQSIVILFPLLVPRRER